MIRTIQRSSITLLAWQGVRFTHQKNDPSSQEKVSHNASEKFSFGPEKTAREWFELGRREGIDEEAKRKTERYQRIRDRAFADGFNRGVHKGLFTQFAYVSIKSNETALVEANRRQPFLYDSVSKIEKTKKAPETKGNFWHWPFFSKADGTNTEDNCSYSAVPNTSQEENSTSAKGTIIEDEDFGKKTGRPESFTGTAKPDDPDLGIKLEYFALGYHSAQEKRKLAYSAGYREGISRGIAIGFRRACSKMSILKNRINSLPDTILEKYENFLKSITPPNNK